MTENLILIVLIALVFFGLLMVLFPNMIEGLERSLNRPVGERPVLSLRTGIPGEQEIEKVLNRTVLGRAIYWDHWLRRQPRTVGALLLAAAVLCIVVVAG